MEQGPKLDSKPSGSEPCWPYCCYAIDCNCLFCAPVIKCIFISCTGQPQPEVRWYKGNEKLKSKKPDKRVLLQYDAVADAHILEVNMATLQDASRYTVKAGNEYGDVKVSAIVQVRKKHVEEERDLEELKATVEHVTSEEISSVANELVEKMDVSVVKVVTTGQKEDKSNSEVLACNLHLTPLPDGSDSTLFLPNENFVQGKVSDKSGTLNPEKSADVVERETLASVSTIANEASRQNLEDERLAKDYKNELVPEPAVTSAKCEMVEDRASDVVTVLENVSREIQVKKSSVEKKGSEKVWKQQLVLNEEKPQLIILEEEKPLLIKVENEPSRILTVEASNEDISMSGDRSSTGTLPCFIIKPQPVTVTEGSAIKLNCKVKG